MLGSFCINIVRQNSITVATIFLCLCTDCGPEKQWAHSKQFLSDFPDTRTTFESQTCKIFHLYPREPMAF